MIYRDYLAIAWQRENFASILETMCETGTNFYRLIEVPMDRVLAKGYLAKSVQILKRFMRDDVSKYFEGYPYSEELPAKHRIDMYFFTIADAAQADKKHGITKQLVNIAKKRWGNEADLSDIHLYNHWKVRGEVGVTSNAYGADSFYNFVEHLISREEHTTILGMLRKHFAIRDPVDIAVKLVENDRSDIVEYWIDRQSAETRSKRLERLSEDAE